MPLTPGGLWVYIEAVCQYAVACQVSIKSYPTSIKAVALSYCTLARTTGPDEGRPGPWHFCWFIEHRLGMTAEHTRYPPTICILPERRFTEVQAVNRDQRCISS